jgi:hypothetical protein
VFHAQRHRQCGGSLDGYVSSENAARGYICERRLRTA